MNDVVKSNISTIGLEGQTAIITIENGPKNLLTEPEFIEKKLLEEWIDTHSMIHSLIITGSGRHFSHGADISLFEAGKDESGLKEISDKLEKAKALLDYIENLPLITVAAINGGCFGGGLEIALSCQFRICSKKAFIGMPEVMHGVIPGMGGMERIYNLIGKQRALQFILGGQIISANDALELGLVTHVSQNDLKNEVEQFIGELTEGKTLVQIKSIVETINMASNGEKNPSKNKFEEVLSDRNKGC